MASSSAAENPGFFSLSSLRTYFLFWVLCWLIAFAIVILLAGCRSSGQGPDGAPLVWRGGSPHAIGDPVFQGPGQARGSRRAGPADPFRLADLAQCGPGRTDREEQVRVGVAAGGIVTPGRAGGHRWVLAADISRHSGGRALGGCRTAPVGRSDASRCSRRRSRPAARAHPGALARTRIRCARATHRGRWPPGRWGRFHRSSFSGTGLALDGAGAALAGNLIGIACSVPLCAYEHRGGAGEQASSDCGDSAGRWLAWQAGGLTEQER